MRERMSETEVQVIVGGVPCFVLLSKAKSQDSKVGVEAAGLIACYLSEQCRFRCLPKLSLVGTSRGNKDKKYASIHLVLATLLRKQQVSKVLRGLLEAFRNT